MCVYVHVQGGRVIPSRVHDARPERFLNAKTCCIGHLEQHLYAILSSLLSPANKMRFRRKTEAAAVTQAGHANRKKKKENKKGGKFSPCTYSLL